MDKILNFCMKLAMAKLLEIVSFCDDLLKINSLKDYDHAYNGLQFENNGTVAKIGAAVDANSLTIEQAIGKKVDLLIAHHGMLWGQVAPISGSIYKKYRLLIDNNLAVYGAHLPLDMHDEIGNNVSIMRILDLQIINKIVVNKTYNFEIPFASAGYTREILKARLSALFPGVKCMEFGPLDPKKIAICSGGGGNLVIDMIQAGADTVITGEAQQHLFGIAHEKMINLYVCGHYATETFGIKNLAKKISNKFDLESIFIEEKCEL